MRFLFVTGLLLALTVWCGRASGGQVSGGHRRLTTTQARQIAVLVAHHDRIDLSDTHYELNSMDLSGDFIPGYRSFIIIRESTTPGPDETLHRYAINQRTGDVWEMTLCTHYDFPELTRMRRSFAEAAVTPPSQLSAQGKQLGCSVAKSAPAL